MRQIKLIAILLAALCACFLPLDNLGRALSLTHAEKEADDSHISIDAGEYERLKSYEKLDEVIRYLEEYYYTQVDPNKLMDDAIRGVLSGLDDPYSMYYDAESWKTLINDGNSDQGGIGVQLSCDYASGKVIISHVFRNTSAHRAGLRRKDVLVSITTESETLSVNADNIFFGGEGAPWQGGYTDSRGDTSQR